MQAFHYIIRRAMYMRAQRKNREEQYQLILECRQSGLSDYAWCQEHGIKVGTFYNWVKRLRKVGNYDIPDPSGKGSYAPSPKQDIVKVELVEEEPVVQIHRAQPNTVLETLPQASFDAALELSMGSANLRISNQADPDLLARVIILLKE